MARRFSGFSLIEVAIVLCIIGILSGIGIPALNNFIKHQKIRKTEDHLELIFQSITSYVLTNKRLPCPAKPTAVGEERGISEPNCLFTEKFIGLVPYRTLGIPEKIVKDGYHNWITYAVNPVLTNTELNFINAPPTSSIPHTAFCAVEKSHLDLKVTNAEKHSVFNSSDSKDFIAIVLVSHGEKGEGSFDLKGERRPTTSADKAVNADDSSNFVDRSFSLTTEDFFDDTIKWITRDNLMALYGNNLVTEADLQVQKQVIRSQMRLILHKIDWTEISISILQKLSTYLQNSFQNKLIAGYSPIENEIQILPFLKKVCLKKGSVCLPVIEKKDYPLKFYSWTPDIEMEPGPYQIPIPKEKIKPILPDIILIPLIAFDRNGYRLGRGGGYYDRTIHALKLIKPIQTIGLAAEQQLLQQLPHSDYDQPLDVIITERQIYRFETW